MAEPMGDTKTEVTEPETDERQPTTPEEDEAAEIFFSSLGKRLEQEGLTKGF